MIEFKHVTKRFGNRLVLNDLSFTIERGETFVIIGQSGMGKTVMLRHIAGLLDPDSGSVIVGGLEMSRANLKVKAEIRERIGLLFQSGALLNWLSVAENVALPLVEHNLFSREEIDRIVDEKLSVLQLSDAKFKMPSDISGGMKKRVGLARVLVRNPEIILYDEPTSGLDPVMSEVINQLILQLQRDFNVTSFVVTHDMGSAYTIADRIAMLYQGKLIQCDTPSKIKATENPIVRQFIEGKLDGPIEVRKE
jgi:phospholipid/cholesterol/gamma-HCH transport system ATP-binding protein